MTSTITTPCMPCRTRKVKCDGQLEQCGPCKRARTKLHCTYDSSVYVEVKPQKRLLQPGGACVTCREKKKKCNGVRPSCDICCKSGEEHQCRYEDRFKLGKIHPGMRPLRRIVSAADKPSVLNGHPRVTRPVESDADPLSKALVSQPSPQDSKYSYSFPETKSFHDITYTFSPIIEGQLLDGHLPVRTGNTYMFSLSEVSLTDMNMSFRLIFLSHRIEIGFHFTKVKEEAIVFGDLSDTVIHPFFIHFAHMMGCNLYQERIGEYCFLYTMCIHLQQTMEALSSMSEEDDPLSYAQAYYFMALLSVYNHQGILGKDYFAKAVQIVDRYDIRFVSQSGYPSLSPSSPFLEEHLERIMFLAHLIYFQLHSTLITNESEDFCHDLRRQFTQELPGTYSGVWQTCPIISRVQATLAGMESMALLTLYKLEGLSASWCSKCLTWLRSVTSCVDILIFRLAEFQSQEDHTSHATYNFLRHYCCAYWAMLVQMSQALRDQQQYRYLQSLQECRLACSKVLNTITNTTAHIIDPTDLKYMIFLFEVYYSCLFDGGEQSKQTGAAAVSRSRPQLKPGSIFSYTTILLSTYYQDKLASVRLNS